MAGPNQRLKPGDKIRQKVLCYESHRSEEQTLSRFIGEDGTLYDWPSQGAPRESRRSYAISATVGRIAQEEARQLVILSRCHSRVSEPWKTLPQPVADFLERRRREGRSPYRAGSSNAI